MPIKNQKLTKMKKNATITIPINNPYGVVCFEDMLLELKRMYDVEKNAKNEVYHYVLKSGNFKDYVEFNRLHKGQNHHLECVRLLELKSN